MYRTLILTFALVFSLSGILPAEPGIDSRTPVGKTLLASQQVESLQAERCIPRTADGQSELDEIIISEDFEDGLPDDWTVTDVAGAGTWFRETAINLGLLEPDYMTITVTNPIDPAQVDYLITPSIDCAAYSDVSLSFDYYIDIFMTETGRVEISTDGGDTYDNVITYNATGGEYPETLDISEWADGEEDVKIRFHYNNQGGIWANDWGIDNFEIEGTMTAGSISGTVTDAETTDPVEEAEVVLSNTETGEDVDTVFTDENGEFSFGQVDGGTYDIVAEAEGYVPNREVNIEVVVGEEVVVELALIPLVEATIERIQTELETGDWVITVGIVTQPTNSTTTEHTDFYIQDTTGYGVRVYSLDPRDMENNLERGDEVRVSGMIEETGGVTEITDFFDVEVLSVENPMPDPLFLSTGEMADNGDMEGSWARINAALMNDPEPEGSYNLTLDDGSGEVTVSIREDTGIDLTEFVEGDWINVEGVISLNQENVQIVPSLTEDVYLTPIYAPTHFTGEIVDSVSGIVELEWRHAGNNEVDGFIEFIMYRNEVEIERTTGFTCIDTLPMPDKDGIYTFAYTVTALYDEGETEPAGPVEVEWTINPVAESDFPNIPVEWAINAIYPNPFNPTVNAIVAVPQAALVRVEIFNLLGKSIAVIKNGRLNAGYNRITWRAGNQPAGLYILCISSDSGFSKAAKLMYIK